MHILKILVKKLCILDISHEEKKLINFISYLNKIIKPALTLIHGSADVEKGFSILARIMTEDRTSMSFGMLNARLAV